MYALIAGAVAAILFSTLSLGKLAVVDMLLYSLGLSLEFIALVRLRYLKPNFVRPFKIPLPNWGLVLMALPTFILALIICVSSVMGEGGSFTQISIVGCAVVSGGVIYYLMKKNKRLEELR